MVPVLSKIIAFARDKTSSPASFLTITRFFEAKLTPPKSAIGVAIINGQGVAIAKTDRALVKSKLE